MPVPRRDLRSSSSAGAAPTPRVIHTLGDITSTQTFQLASSSLFPGTASCVRAFVMRFNAINVAADLRLGEKFTSATRGMRPNILTASPTIDRPSISAVSSAPANVNAVRTAPAVWDTTKFYTLAFRIDGGNLAVFLNGAKLGADTAITGYTAATSADLFSLIRPASGSSIAELAAAVFVEATSVSDANILTWHNQVVAGNNFDFPTGTTEVFSANDLSVGAAPATWAGRKSYATLDRQGTPTIYSYTSPVFA